MKINRKSANDMLPVYAYGSTAGWKQQLASELLASLWDPGGGCLSIQVLQEFYVVATRKVPAPLDPVFAAQVVRDLGQWTVFAPGVADVLAAIDAHQRNRVKPSPACAWSTPSLPPREPRPFCLLTSVFSS